MTKQSLAVFFAKKPEAGKVKTRLCPPLDPVAAAELYHCFLQDLFRRFGITHPHFKLGVAYFPEGAEEFFERITPAGTEFFVQNGENLAQRMAACFAQAFAEGYQQVAILGTDIPFLSVERVGEIFEILKSGADVAIGPDAGGGYYALGLRKPAEFLFCEAEISSKEIFANTVKRAKEKNLHVAELSQESDVDYPEDLLQLVNLLVKHPKLKLQIPYTAEFLRQLGYLDDSGSNLTISYLANQSK